MRRVLGIYSALNLYLGFMTNKPNVHEGPAIAPAKGGGGCGHSPDRTP